MLQPVAGPEHRALRLPDAVGRRRHQGARGGQFLVRIGDGEAALVVLPHLGPGIRPGAPVPEAGHVHREDVARGLALDHPFRQREPYPAPLAEARHHRARRPVVAQARHRADQRIAVRREGEGAADDALHPGRLQHRIALVRDPELVRHAVELLGQELVPEVLRRPVHRPQLARLLVHADHEATPLLAQVALAGRVHAVRKLGVALVHLGQIAGDQVLVLHRVAGQVHPGHRADLARPQARRVDHVLGVHRALHRHHVPMPVRTGAKLPHRVAQHDLRALHPGALRIRLRGAGGVEVAVEGIVERPEQSGGVGDRREARDLLRPHDLGVEPHVAVLGALRLEEIETVAVRREGEPAHVVQPAGLAGELFELAVEADGVALQRGHVGVGVQGVEAPCRVPGRAGGQLGALDEHDIAPAQPGEVVEHAAPHHPAADHRDPHVGFHGGLHGYCPPCVLRGSRVRARMPCACARRAAPSGTPRPRSR